MCGDLLGDGHHTVEHGFLRFKHLVYKPKPLGFGCVEIATRVCQFTHNPWWNQFWHALQSAYIRCHTNFGFFDGEITPFPGKGQFECDGLTPRKFKCANRDGLSHDEHPRQTTLENLAKLPPVFSKNGPTTAGNASGIVDGAASVIVASGDFVRANGLKPLGKIRGFSSVGVEPDIMGIGPAPSIRSILNALDMQVNDIDRFEINEAFSAQVLSCARELNIDENNLNVNGGAVALGHPLGVTGLRLALTVLRTLERDDKELGVASACIGGGQGIAMVVEKC